MLFVRPTSKGWSCEELERKYAGRDIAVLSITIQDLCTMLHGEWRTWILWWIRKTCNAKLLVEWQIPEKSKRIKLKISRLGRNSLRYSLRCWPIGKGIWYLYSLQKKRNITIVQSSLVSPLSSKLIRSQRNGIAEGKGQQSDRIENHRISANEMASNNRLCTRRKTGRHNSLWTAKFHSKQQGAAKKQFKKWATSPNPS